MNAVSVLLILLLILRCPASLAHQYPRYSPHREIEVEGLPATDEQRLLSTLTFNYDPAVRPVFDAKMPVIIKLGITLTQIIDIDEKNQVLTTNVWLDQEWTDEKLKWNKSLHNDIGILRMPCDFIWLPDIVLYNSVDNHNKGYMRSLAMVHHDGTVFWPPIVRMRSSCKMDITFFPFDDQLCALVLGSWAYDGFQVDVTNRSENVDLTNYVDNGEWELLGTKVIRRVKNFTCCPEPFIDVTFYLMIRRRVLYYFLNVIIPCMLLSSLSLTGFLLPPDSGEKVTLGLTVLLAFSVFMLLVAENMPPTSEYIPLIGIYLTVIMAMSALSVALSVFVLNCHHRGTSMHRPPRLVRGMSIAVAKMFCMRLLYLNKSVNVNNTHSFGASDRQTLIDDPHFTPPPQQSSGIHYQSTLSNNSRNSTQITPTSSLHDMTSQPIIDEADNSGRSCNGSVAAGSAHRTTNSGRGRLNSTRSLMEGQILYYLKSVLEAYDRGHGERTAVLEWQEVARVLDKFFFWLFVAITFMTTVFLLLISPITKHLEFPEE
ncbi:neuronal acetylcholine receptor subunit alpha-10-like precursor [Aplysia californica]|uniref:Neuronal acetylcholine receptor subunit alpha-10-like precursor n=1 Tax=Aplysia californica TaxID=6500 RepID=M4VRP0_APLCA|nr:neuronal acetylcholine receptor subunit alpha-10-like precursor [Aplysia californica]AGI03858.1 nicotinic acetylcholine receptor subunit type R [Aplysia californica]